MATAPERDGRDLDPDTSDLTVAGGRFSVTGNPAPWRSYNSLDFAMKYAKMIMATAADAAIIGVWDGPTLIAVVANEVGGVRVHKLEDWPAGEYPNV